MKKHTKSDIVPEKLERKAFTVKETADMLAVSPMTIRRSIKDGKIEAIRISPNGRYRICMLAIENFMKQTQK